MTDLDDHWAWRRIEAAADGSLTRRETRRMHAALRRNPELVRALERARALRHALRQLRDEPAPRSFRPRLLAIAASRHVPGRAAAALVSWASAGAAACALAAAWLVLLLPGAGVHDPRNAALQEFEIAMGYLHRSYRIAGDHVQRAMLRELEDTLEFANRRGRDGRRDENGG